MAAVVYALKRELKWYTNEQVMYMKRTEHCICNIYACKNSPLLPLLLCDTVELSCKFAVCSRRFLMSHAVIPRKILYWRVWWYMLQDIETSRDDSPSMRLWILYVGSNQCLSIFCDCGRTINQHRLNQIPSTRFNVWCFLEDMAPW